MFSGKCLAVSFFRVWGSSGYPGRAKSDEDRKCPPIIRRLRIGAKSAISNVRTDTESGGMADEGDREGTRSKRLLSSDLSTAAGETNAGRKPASVEPQQQIQRGFSLWAL
jgi:hypothetical protein